MKLVTKYFRQDNLMESSFLKRTGSNELLFNFLTNSFVITVFSGLEKSLTVFTEIFIAGTSAKLSSAVGSPNLPDHQ